VWPPVFNLILKYFEPGKVIADLGCGKHVWKWKDSRIMRCDINLTGFPYHDFNEEIKFWDKFVDYSVAVEVIEHLENPLYFLREIKRITEERAIITHPIGPFYTPSTYDSMGHISIMTEWLMKKHLEKVGLKLIECQHIKPNNMVYVVEV